MNKAVIGSMLVLICFRPLYGQSQPSEQGIQYPTTEEVAANKRLGELLRHPSFMTLRIVAIPASYKHEKPSDAPSAYFVDDGITLHLFETQSLPEVLTFERGFSPYYEYRPELFKDGDIVPLKRVVAQRVEDAEKQPFGISGAVVNLLSAKEYESAFISLGDWYDRLSPGHYQVRVNRRYAWDGDWAQSNSITFDVQPRTHSESIPAGVTVELVPESFQDKPKQAVYRLNGITRITVIVVNGSNDELKVPVIDSYYANRPQLFKNGVRLPYKEDITKLLNLEDENPGAVEISLDLSIAAKERAPLMNLSLNDWYAALGPGHYKLINRRRFEIDGPWTRDSAELWFDIVP